MSDVIIFSGTYVSAGLPFRSAGPYRIATEVRTRNLSCQVILYLQAIDTVNLEKICEKFIGSHTLLVCFSTTLWYYMNKEEIIPKVKQIIDYTRTKYSKVLIVFGGTCTEIFIDDFDGDYYFTGYGEHYFNMFLDYLIGKNDVQPLPTRIKNNKKIYDWTISNDKFDFTNSKISYDKSDLISNDEALPIEIARGCIFKCKFCAYPLTGKKKLDFIKEKNILKEELIENYEKWGTTHYILSDDTFNDSTLKLEYLNELFFDLPFKFKFTAYLRHDLIYRFPEQISLLKNLGLMGTFFGVETFHHRAAKLIGKGLDPNITKEFLYKIKEDWGNDITIQLGLITGIPYEDYESYKNTIDFIKRKDCPIEAFNVNPLTVIHPSKHFLHFKSIFQTEAENYGFKWPDDNNSNFWTNSIGPVKDWNEAISIRNEIYTAAKEEGRINFGGMSHLPLKNLSRFTQYKSIEKWMSIDRKLRVKKMNFDIDMSKFLMVKDYIEKLLNL